MKKLFAVVLSLVLALTALTAGAEGAPASHESTSIPGLTISWDNQLLRCVSETGSGEEIFPIHFEFALDGEESLKISGDLEISEGLMDYTTVTLPQEVLNQWKESADAYEKPYTGLFGAEQVMTPEELENQDGETLANLLRTVAYQVYGKYEGMEFMNYLGVCFGITVHVQGQSPAFDEETNWAVCEVYFALMDFALQALDTLTGEG